MNQFTKIIFLSLMLFIVFIIFFHPINAITQDLGRHLLTGKIILESKNVPKMNLYSYTNTNFPFINTHWLSEVIYYLLFKTLNFSGLLFISTITAILAFAIILIYALLRFNIFICAFASLLYFQIMLERTDIRPEIFSFLFISIFIVILYLNRYKKTKLLFLLIPIEALWVNMHIYFAIGIVLLFIFITEQLFINRKRLWQSNKQLIIVTTLCCLATLLNPWGIKGALYPLNVFSNYGYSIEENQSIFFLNGLYLSFHSYTIIFLVTTAILLFIFIILIPKKQNLLNFFLLIVFVVGASEAVRNLPLFVFATYIAFCESLDRLLKTRFNDIKLNTKWQIAVILLLLFFSFLSVKSVIARNGFGTGFPSNADKGVNFFLSNNLKGPIFNNFDIGSYLEYRLYPKYKVFVDGRPEAYPSSFFQNIYIPIQENPELFNSEDGKYHFSTIFFSHTDATPWAQQFLAYILRTNDWKLVYLDSYSIILVRNSSANRPLIKNVITDSSFQLPDNLSQKDLMQYISFFQEVNWQSQEKNALIKLLKIDPNN